jgi:hypothetical protein
MVVALMQKNADLYSRLVLQCFHCDFRGSLPDVVHHMVHRCVSLPCMDCGEYVVAHPKRIHGQMMFHTETTCRNPVCRHSSCLRSVLPALPALPAASAVGEIESPEYDKQRQRNYRDSLAYHKRVHYIQDMFSYVPCNIQDCDVFSVPTEETMTLNELDQLGLLLEKYINTFIDPQ